MAKRKGMKFRTTQEKKTKQFRLFVLGFVGFLLAFALVSVAYMFKSHHLSINDLFPERKLNPPTGAPTRLSRRSAARRHLCSPASRTKR